jgi:hypothetical protein
MSGGEDEQSGLIDLGPGLGNLRQDGAFQEAPLSHCDKSRVGMFNVPCSRRYLPNVFRAGSLTRVSIMSSARCAVPMDRMQWWIRPGLVMKSLISLALGRIQSDVTYPSRP